MHDRIAVFHPHAIAPQWCFTMSMMSFGRTLLFCSLDFDLDAQYGYHDDLTGAVRNLIVAAMQNTANSNRTASCVSLNGGSDCVGAMSLSAGIFRSACTMPTKTLK